MIVGVINVQFIILILTLSLHIAAMNQSLTMECLSKRLLPTLLPPSVPGMAFGLVWDDMFQQYMYYIYILWLLLYIIIILYYCIIIYIDNNYNIYIYIIWVKTDPWKPTIKIVRLIHYFLVGSRFFCGETIF